MPIAELVLSFRLPGCRSLKERRGRLRGLRDRFGRQPGLAVFEDPSDQPQQARWHVISAASDQRLAQQQLDQVLEKITGLVDAEVQVQRRCWLASAHGSEGSKGDQSLDLIDRFFAQTDSDR